MFQAQSLFTVMNMQQPSKLIIDPDVSALFLPPDHYSISMIRQNIRLGIPPAPFPVWNNTLMDRIYEYKEYADTGITIKTQSFSFRSKNAMLASICQLLAADIVKATPYKMYLVGKHYQYYKAAYYKGEIDSPYENISLKELRKKYTKDIHQSIVPLVDMYEISPTTIHFYSRYARAIDDIRKTDEKTANLILSGKVNIPKKKVLDLRHLSKKQWEEYLQMLKGNVSKKNPVLKISGNIPVDIEKKHIDNRIIPEIKQMPKYDPDADVSSLALTIPSWAESIRRVRTRSIMSEVSQGAADNLIFQLGILEKSIQIIKTELEGINRNAK